ncbi:hypothetical protein K491DRAFT_104968 [Lophiostoma macrostomum CBS 122681]|uniref:Uncharacterized protein n=1 Tax=Lophiostoma macrostomum CBS 122681 TaxID=1314788 RepID=A0A6A6STH3_9PLEO|nr:hypothetical protein K491DRAFT_104968 [Lophiostoma macrostomum CBS 122681]
MGVEVGVGLEVEGVGVQVGVGVQMGRDGHIAYLYQRLNTLPKLLRMVHKPRIICTNLILLDIQERRRPQPIPQFLCESPCVFIWQCFDQAGGCGHGVRGRQLLRRSYGSVCRDKRVAGNKLSILSTIRYPRLRTLRLDMVSDGRPYSVKTGYAESFPVVSLAVSHLRQRGALLHTLTRLCSLLY